MFASEGMFANACIYRLNSNLKICAHREKRMRTLAVRHRPRNAGRSEGDKMGFPTFNSFIVVLVVSCLPLPHHRDEDYITVVITLVVLSLSLVAVKYAFYYLYSVCAMCDELLCKQ